jgi:hypothetical protein
MAPRLVANGQDLPPARVKPGGQVKEWTMIDGGSEHNQGGENEDDIWSETSSDLLPDFGGIDRLWHPSGPGSRSCGHGSAAHGRLDFSERDRNTDTHGHTAPTHPHSNSAYLYARTYSNALTISDSNSHPPVTILEWFGL